MLAVVVECKPDRLFVSLILQACGIRAPIYHEATRGEVVKVVAKQGDVIGVVDADPGSAWPSDFHKYFRPVSTFAGIKWNATQDQQTGCLLSLLSGYNSGCFGTQT